MRKAFLIILTIGVMAPNAFAGGEDFGIGIIAGEPTGLSGKMWLTRSTAIDGALAWSFGDGGDALHLHGDYLVHNSSLFDVDKGVLALHFGVGGRVKFADDTLLGVRVPVGLTYFFDNVPLDVFGEIVPILDLVNETEINLNAAIGVRYFFGQRNY
jgi:hypothetical protein